MKHLGIALTLAAGALALGISGCAPDEQTPAKSGVQGMVLDYGILALKAPKTTIRNPKTPDGMEVNAPGATFIRRTDRIPAVLGTRFGFRYWIKGLPGSGPVDFKTVVTHPAMKCSSGEVKTGYTLTTTLTATDGELSAVTGYGFDHEFERVAGEWTFTFFYKGERVVSQTFTVHVPKGIELDKARRDSQEIQYEVLEKILKAAELAPRKHIPDLIEVLKYSGDDERMYQRSVDFPGDTSDSCPERALKALVGIGADACPAIIALLEGPEVPSAYAPIRKLPDGTTKGGYVWRASSFEHVWKFFQRLGEDGAPAVPELTRILKTSDWKQRTIAAICLGEIGRPSLPALPQLIRAIDDERHSVRHRAIDAIVKLGDGGREALPRIRGRLKDSNEHVRNAALEALLAFDSDKLPVIRKALSDRSGIVNATALEAIVKLGVKARGLAPLIMGNVEKIERASEEVRSQIFWDPGEPALDAILAVRTEDPKVIERLVRAAIKGRWYEPLQRDTGDVVVIGGSTEDELGDEVVRFFENLENKKAARACIPMLLKCVDGHGLQREWGLRILAELGPPDASTVKALMPHFASLEHTRPRNFLRSCEPYILLRHARQEPEEGRPGELMRRILAAGGPLAVPGLVKTYRTHKPKRVRRAVLDTFAMMKPEVLADSPEVMEILKEAVKDDDAPTAKDAKNLLRKIKTAEEK